MNDYQLLCIFPGTLAETEVPGAVGEVQGLITQEGGTILETEDLGKRRLAYPMKQIRYGYYHHLFFQAEGEHIQKIRKKLPLMGGLLRTMVFEYSPTGRAAQRAWAERRATAKRQMGIEERVDESKVGGEEAVEEQPRVKETKAPVVEERGKVDLKEIDKKLDELLEGSIEGV